MLYLHEVEDARRQDVAEEAAETAEERYEKVVENQGGDLALKKGADVTRKAQSNLKSVPDRLRKERESVWAQCGPAQQKSLRKIADELSCTFERQDRK